MSGIAIGRVDEPMAVEGRETVGVAFALTVIGERGGGLMIASSVMNGGWSGTREIGLVGFLSLQSATDRSLYERSDSVSVPLSAVLGR